MKLLLLSGQDAEGLHEECLMVVPDDYDPLKARDEAAQRMDTDDAKVVLEVPLPREEWVLIDEYRAYRA